MDIFYDFILVPFDLKSIEDLIATDIWIFLNTPFARRTFRLEFAVVLCKKEKTVLLERTLSTCWFSFFNRTLYFISAQFEQRFELWNSFRSFWLLHTHSPHTVCAHMINWGSKSTLFRTLIWNSDFEYFIQNFWLRICSPKGSPLFRQFEEV